MFNTTDRGLVFFLMCEQCGKESPLVEKPEIDRVAAQLVQEMKGKARDLESHTAEDRSLIEDALNFFATEKALIDRGWLSTFANEEGMIHRVSLCPEHAKLYAQADLN